MALFGKKKKEENKNLSEIPELPALPPLPRLPDFNSDNMPFKPNALPRFPPSSLGDKFSQTTIKEAISGEKEDEMANESEEIETMPNLPEGPLTREISSSEFPEFPERKIRPIYPREIAKHPMYVRLDKFEENLEIFEKIKRQLIGVEKILDDIKRTKEQEDKELGEWQTRLQAMKEQIEKIDRDIFSKIE